MRATLADVRRHPSWLGSWWLDWPARRRSFWSQLLFEPGQGWLRWGTDTRMTAPSWDPPIPGDEYVVAPPLRRAAWNLNFAWDWLRNDHGLRSEPFTLLAGKGFHRDDDRKRNLSR